MGWCCSTAADETLARIERAAAVSREGTGERSHNVFYCGGRRYFFEVTRRDQVDGGITGAIFLTEGDMARKVGSFKIDGRGRLIRGPKLFRDAAVRTP